MLFANFWLCMGRNVERQEVGVYCHAGSDHFGLAWAVPKLRGSYDGLRNLLNIDDRGQAGVHHHANVEQGRSSS